VSKSRLEEVLAIELSHDGIPYEREVRFHPKRRWRFDFVFPGREKLAVEIDGGTWQQGRHQRPEGYQADCEKMNAAALMGWCVLRFTGKMVLDGDAVATIKEALDAKADE